MADTVSVKISELTAADTIDGTENIPLVQVESTRRATTAQIRSYIVRSTVPIDIGAVPSGRQVSTSGLLTGGGDLSSDRTITIAAQTQNVVIGRTASGTGPVSALSAPMISVILASDAASVRSVIGLGTAATANSTDFEPRQLVATRSVDADVTFVAADAPIQRFTGTLTAARSVTLPSSGISAGQSFRISRTGSGAFALNVGAGPLKALSTGQWCDVHYDGSAWFLTAAGSL